MMIPPCVDIAFHTECIIQQSIQQARNRKKRFAKVKNIAHFSVLFARHRKVDNCHCKHEISKQTSNYLTLTDCYIALFLDITFRLVRRSFYFVPKRKTLFQALNLIN